MKRGKMNKKCLKFTWVILFLLSGCVTTADKYLKCHPDTPAPIKSSMKQNVLCIGMTREQVTAVRGKPSQIAEDEFDNKETWTYSRPDKPLDAIYCGFENDKLLRIETIEQRRLRQNEIYFKNHPERSKFKTAALEKKLLMEMNRKEAKLSRGEPKEINRNETPYSAFEQWVYDTTDKPNYLYFTDDKLISWHD